MIDVVLYVHSTYIYTYYVPHTSLYTSSYIKYLTHVSHVSEGRVIVSAREHFLWCEWCDSRTREEALEISLGAGADKAVGNYGEEEEDCVTTRCHPR